jgi:hypothetical protein
MTILPFFTHYRSFVNQSDIKILIKDMVALEAMLDCCINPLSVCDLVSKLGSQVRSRRQTDALEGSANHT